MTRFGSSFLSCRSWRLPVAGALLAALAACSSGPPLFLSDGRPTVQVQCPASGDRDSCVQQARSRCGGAGYDNVAQTTEGNNFTLVFACRAAAQ